MPLKNLNVKPSVVKPLVALVALVIIAAAIFAFFSDKKKTVSAIFGEQTQTNPSGLDQNEEIETVEDVEKVIAKWIEANPQAILQSVANMQKKMAEEQMKDAQKNIGDKKSELLDGKSPQYAPAGYDVTVVEFFDYNCGYCKRANTTVEQLLKEDKKVRVIYKEFPILGEASIELAKVAVAVHILNSSSYRKFHDALMKSSERNKAGALKIAKSVGIDVKKLEEVLKKEEAKINEMIQANIALGSSIGINGTPGFVIGEELVPGAIDIQTFREKVSAARK